MECEAAFVYEPELAQYNHGGGHPLRPERFVLTRELVDAYGLLARPGITEMAGRVATTSEIELVHDPRYVEAVVEAGEGVPGDWRQFGLGPGDNPVFQDMHVAAARVTGATLTAAQQVLRGPGHAFSPAGGLHHAMPDRASGFCVYNDPAIAIRWMLDQGIERVAYVDLDVHHGDGVQAVFYDDPRVLTISVHESGRFLFPGTGAIRELGSGAAEGTSVNIPLPPETADEDWLHAVRSVVPQLVRAWRPEVLVTQLGCDTHATDPLAHLSLTTEAYREAAAMMHQLAHDAAGGKWLATGGGGYQWATVAPRAWCIYFAEMTGARPPDALPREWRTVANGLSDYPVPYTLSEESTGASRYGGEIERIVTAVREAVAPRLGLEF